MKLDFYTVDAFADRPFAGNPAVVVPLAAPLPDAVMQAMAAEHNVSETAFLLPEPGGWHLRWFTPTVEVEMCGHATLAAGFVLASVLGQTPPFTFRTASGPLHVDQAEGRLVLDFPALPPVQAEAPQGLAAALGATPREVWAGRDWLAVFDDADTVRGLAPDHEALLALPDNGRGPARVIATAPGDGGHDTVSRYFAIKSGIAEDPVTGTAHTQI